MLTDRGTVLLAGAGDLCRRAGRILSDRGHEVWGLRRHPPACDTSGIRWLACDLTRPATLSRLPENISHVVYGPAPDARTEAQYRAIFLDGLQNLLGRLDAARLKRFVFLSSSAVYGEHGGAWIDETTPAAPARFSGRVLLEAERRLARVQANSIVLRLAGLYGPGRMELVSRLRQGTAAVPRHGNHWANRFHIEDAARAVAHLLESPDFHACYIGADDTPHRIGELYDAIAAMAGARPPKRTGGEIGTGSKRLSNARLRSSGFTPMWPDTIAGYRALLGKP